MHGFLIEIFLKILNTIPPLGNMKCIAPGILEMCFLTPLLLGNNQLQRIPAEIAQLSNLTVLEKGFFHFIYCLIYNAKNSNVRLATVSKKKFVTTGGIVLKPRGLFYNFGECMYIKGKLLAKFAEAWVFQKKNFCSFFANFFCESFVFEGGFVLEGGVSGICDFGEGTPPGCQLYNELSCMYVV